MSARNLGRGLNALLGDVDEPVQQPQGIKTVLLSDLEPSQFQPRRVFDEEALRDLVESVKTKGVIQPLIVRERVAGKYEIIGGERRWRAAQQAGLNEVPVLVKNFSDKEAMEVALIENLQRQDLNPLEEAEGYRRLMEEFSNTQEELAQAVGKSRSHVANTMRLLALPEKVKGYLEKGKLTSGHARALLTSKDPEALADAVIAKGLNVRQTEKLAQDGIEKKPRKTQPKKMSDKQADCDSLAADLSRALGIKVAIRPKTVGGDLILTYETLEQLDVLIRRLSAQPAKRPAETSDTLTAGFSDNGDTLSLDQDDIGEVVFDSSFDSMDGDTLSLENIDK